MFIFVFMWTPALEAAHDVSTQAAAANGKAAVGEALPHGMVFACFMACIMLGSRSVSALLKLSSAGQVASFAFVAAALCLAVPMLQPTQETQVMLAFCGFEVVCGMYFPLAGIQRSRIVPEAMRSMIMNVFRVGLNAVVMSVLLNIGTMQQQTVFRLCVGCLLVCALAQMRLCSIEEHASGKGHDTKDSAPSSPKASAADAEQ